MTIQDWMLEKKTKILALQEARNGVGYFKVATHSPNGNWSKHIDVLELWEKMLWGRLDSANNRTIFENEVVLDLDPPQGWSEEEVLTEAKYVANKLIEEGFRFKSYFSGSRGYHFHLLFDYILNFEQRKVFRAYFIKRFNCDLMKASDKTMIALEHTPHWKTGKMKRLVELC